MKRSLIRLLTGCVAALTLAMTTYAQKTQDPWTEAYIKANIAITSIKARAVSESTYVNEITIRDFGNARLKPQGFGMKGQIFADNGRGTDRVAGDGVFTSTTIQRYKTTRVREKERNTVFYDEAFLHTAKLAMETPASKVKIKCKFKKCGCPCPGGGTCPACEWFSWSCWEITECDIELDF